MQIERLNDLLLRSPSITQTLQEWCDEHDPPAARITLERLLDSTLRPADDVTIDALWPRQPEKIHARSVWLLRRGNPICKVDSWFIPDRLSPEIFAALKSTNVTFGSAVRALKPIRRTLSAQILQSGTKTEPWKQIMAPLTVILEHKAVISDSDGFPLCVAHEHYLAPLLAMNAPDIRAGE